MFRFLGLIFRTLLIGVALAVLVNYVQAAFKTGNPFPVWLPEFVVNQFAKFFAQAMLFSVVSVPSSKVMLHLLFSN